MASNVLLNLKFIFSIFGPLTVVSFVAILFYILAFTLLPKIRNFQTGTILLLLLCDLCVDLGQLLRATGEHRPKSTVCLLGSSLNSLGEFLSFYWLVSSHSQAEVGPDA